VPEYSQASSEGTRWLRTDLMVDKIIVVYVDGSTQTFRSWMEDNDGN